MPARSFYGNVPKVTNGKLPRSISRKEDGVHFAAGEEGGSMTTPLDPKQVVTFEELLMSQVVSQDALIRLLIAKGLFTKDEFLEMVKNGG
jgi:hypothetical protein